MRISDWSSDVCSSDLVVDTPALLGFFFQAVVHAHRLAVGLGDQAAHHDVVGIGVAAKRQQLDGGGLGDADQGAAVGADQGAPEGICQRRLLFRGGLAPVATGGQLGGLAEVDVGQDVGRSEEHTSELQSLMRISYAVFCLKKTKNNTT